MRQFIRVLVIGWTMIPLGAGDLSSEAAAAGKVRSATPIYLKLEADDFGGMGRRGSGLGWEPRMAWYPPVEPGGRFRMGGTPGSAKDCHG